MLTIDEAADRAGVGPDTVVRKIEDGTLVGEEWTEVKIPEGSFAEWMEDRNLRNPRDVYPEPEEMWEWDEGGREGLLGKWECILTSPAIRPVGPNVLTYAFGDLESLGCGVYVERVYGNTRRIAELRASDGGHFEQDRKQYGGLTREGRLWGAEVLSSPKIPERILLCFAAPDQAMKFNLVDITI